MTYNTTIPNYNTNYYNTTTGTTTGSTTLPTYATNTLGTNSAYTTSTDSTTLPAYIGTSTITTEAKATEKTSSSSSDGKDDGKLSFWEKLKAGASGAVKGLVNGVKDVVTNPGKLALAVGCVALSIACPPAGVALAVAGGAMGAYQIGKGAIRASEATTDAEAKAAYEDIGGGVMQVGLSVAGAKAGLKSCSSATEAFASGEGVVGKLSGASKGLAQDTAASLKLNGGKFGNNLVENVSSANGVGAKIKAVGQTATDSYSESALKTDGLKGLYSNLKEAGYKKYTTEAQNAETAMQKAASKIENKEVQQVASKYEKLDKTDAKAVKEFKSELDKTAKKADLSKEEKAALAEYQENLKAVEKANNKVSKIDKKAAKKADETTEGETVKKGSAITGAKSKFQTLMKQSVENNAKALAERSKVNAETLAEDLKAANNKVTESQKTLKQAKTEAEKETAQEAVKAAKKEVKDLKANKKLQKTLDNAEAYTSGKANIFQKASVYKNGILSTAAVNVSNSNEAEVSETTTTPSTSTTSTITGAALSDLSLPDLAY